MFIKFRDLTAKLRRGAEEGATAVEYGVMVALIAAVIVAIVYVVGQQVRGAFCNTSSALTAGGATPVESALSDSGCPS